MAVDHPRSHSHAHHHRAAPGADTGKLTIALALIAAFMVVEVVVGLLVSSLALLSDAGHMLTDAAALAVSVLAARLARRPAGGAMTYGFRRAEILSAQFNGATDPSRVDITDAQGVGTITNDDTAHVTISDVSHNEGNSGTTSYTFTASLSTAADQPVTLTMRQTSTRWNGRSAYCGTVLARRAVSSSVTDGEGSGSCSSCARTHHSRLQSSASQCSISRLPRGSASRLSSRCRREEVLGLTRSIGTPTWPSSLTA